MSHLTIHDMTSDFIKQKGRLYELTTQLHEEAKKQGIGVIAMFSNEEGSDWHITQTADMSLPRKTAAWMPGCIVDDASYDCMDKRSSDISGYFMKAAAAYPYRDFKTKLDVENAQGGEPVNAIKDFNEAFWRDRCCNRCRYFSCGLHPLYVKLGTSEMFRSPTGVKANFCPNVHRVIYDHSTDINLRTRIKIQRFKGDSGLFPSQLHELTKSEGSKHPSPITEEGFIRDGVDRTGIEWEPLLFKHLNDKTINQIIWNIGEES